MSAPQPPIPAELQPAVLDAACSVLGELMLMAVAAIRREDYEAAEQYQHLQKVLLHPLKGVYRTHSIPVTPEERRAA